MKNVAGYDLCKLFVGSRGSLGVIVEAVFKLRPLPEAEQFIQARCESLDQAGRVLDLVLESELMPVVLDLHNLSTLHSPPSTHLFLVLGFAGSREEVEWQLEQGKSLGLHDNASLDYEKAFWASSDGAAVRSRSVLPSRLIETLRDLTPVSFVARAGHGAVFHRGGKEPSERAELPLALMRRLKQTYDPKNILPEVAL